MSPEEFEKNIKAKGAEIKEYAKNRMPTVVGNIALRFIDGNFRAGGYQGSTFKKWKKGVKKTGKTLIDTSAMRNANYFLVEDGATRLKNDMPYAKIHNEGFNGTVNIPKHKRNIMKKTRVETNKLNKSGTRRKQTLTSKKSEVDVKAHTRKMNIPQRQFMPITKDDSPILKKAVVRHVARDLKQIIEK